MSEYAVVGLIGARWRSWGGSEGAFGKAVGPEVDVPDRNGRRQAFERGEISWSPDQDMVLSIFRLYGQACFEFSKTGFGYEGYRLNYAYNGESQGVDSVLTNNRDPQSSTIIFWVGLQGYGDYEFNVRGVDDDDESPQGWPIPVRTRLEPVPGLPDPTWPPVTGVISERWHELGAWDGPLGKPTGREDFNPAGGIRNQEFEFGRIFTAPELGPFMVVAAYQRGRSIEAIWGGSDIGFEQVTVEVTYNGTVIRQEVLHTDWSDGFYRLSWARPRTRGGRYRLDATQGDGLYTFTLYAQTTHGTLLGSTPTVPVLFERGHHDAFIETLATDTTPGIAFASHLSRATSIAKHYVQTRRIDLQPFPATEDNTVLLVANLHLASVEPAFRVQGELPPRMLVHALLRSLNRGHGQVGTSYNKFIGVRLKRDGDYDMALKGVMVIAYRYRQMLTQEQYDFILDVLVPAHLNGPHDPDIESYTVLTEDLPETENHMLMINSTRYLANQLHRDRIDQARFNNVDNGLAGWLLNYMHIIAKHDFLEFSSRPYQRLSLHVMFNLHEFARDETVRNAAKILLDYAMAKFAISSVRQRRVNPFRRMKGNTNSPDRINDLLRAGIGGDPATGFFLMYAGPSDRDGKPFRWFPDEWVMNAMLAGLADYRPAPAVYILALTKQPAGQHVFHHGRRPQMYEADEDADGGVEIYHRSPSFLLTAGGIWLNSGYGLDEWLGYEQVAIAQSTTLMLTRAFDIRVKPEDLDLRAELDTKFADLIRFDRWPSLNNDGEPLERDAVNNGVHLGFACGANLQVPDLWLQLSGTTWDGPWLFLDLNRRAELLPEHLRPYGPLGVYVAIYRTALTPVDAARLEAQYDAHPPSNVGFLYVVEADEIDFPTFRDQIKARNSLANPLLWDSISAFHTPDGHKYDFWIRSDGGKYRARVELDDDSLPPGGFGSLPLASGPFLQAPNGHDGMLKIWHSGCAEPLILDYRISNNPLYLDNAASCPKAWLERASALYTFAFTLRGAKRAFEAALAMIERVNVCQHLADADPGKYKPLVATALFDLNYMFRAALPVPDRWDFAGQGLTVYEELAGLRVPGAEGPVDYEQLGGLTPNEYWDWARLTGALYCLAWIGRETGDHVAAASWTVKRIRVWQRLAQIDSVKYKPKVAETVFELLYYHHGGLDAAAKAAFAGYGLTVYEELAGLRMPGTEGPVDYEQLTGFAPNEYWPWQNLDGALRNVAYTCKAAGDHPNAAAAALKRVRVYEHLLAADAVTHRPMFAIILSQLVHDFLGLEPAAVLSFAHQGVRENEILAGLRPAGTTNPVNYDQLASFTPNRYWPSPYLGSALYNLAHTLRSSGDPVAGFTAMRSRVRVAERLYGQDPIKWQAELDLARRQAASFET